VNTECCIQLNPGENPDTSGPHWYCDAVAVDFRNKHVFLCEISYSAQLSDLAKRLKGWHENWTKVCEALKRDCALPESWPVRPWLFVPEYLVPLLQQRLDQFQSGQPLNFVPLITTLEMVQPWHYRSWNRIGELSKPSAIREAMRA
jgi:hypothetical protein